MFHNFIFVLLLWPTAASSGDIYIAMVGQTVLLPCFYVMEPRNKPVPICWGKGSCPLYDCNEKFLSTNGRKVTQQKIKRYQLKGDLVQGNVALTIENVKEADSGIYCCRIQFPGLFNDKKTTLQLVVKPAETTTFRFQPQQTSRSTPSNNLTSYDFTTENDFSSITNILEITSPANELQKFGDTTRTWIFIGVSIFMVLVLALALSTLILKWHSNSKKKLQNISVISMLNPPPKNIRAITEERLQVKENIYTIE
ncbi:hepatitis A virus cellular receptor 2 homolog [Macrotis lagotis]|uniref:hepatitis A virus cellular receptor 2 homolog n=1 Tax=Macrotis lagotis TaxID=92651 RepID=UPI003D69748D